MLGGLAHVRHSKDTVTLRTPLWREAFDQNLVCHPGGLSCFVLQGHLNWQHAGRIARLLGQAASRDLRCSKCEDDRRLEGMEILRGVKEIPGQDLTWGQGDILDPASGKAYKVRLSLSRNQIWVRIE